MNEYRMNSKDIKSVMNILDKRETLTGLTYIRNSEDSRVMIRCVLDSVFIEFRYRNTVSGCIQVTEYEVLGDRIKFSGPEGNITILNVDEQDKVKMYDADEPIFMTSADLRRAEDVMRGKKKEASKEDMWKVRNDGSKVYLCINGAELNFIPRKMSYTARHTFFDSESGRSRMYVSTSKTNPF